MIVWSTNNTEKNGRKELNKEGEKNNKSQT